MLTYLLHALENYGIAVPHLFFYTTFKMLMSAIFSFVLTIAVGKLFIAKLVSLKVGHKVRVSECVALADKYDKSSQIPSMGGVLFIFSMVVSSFLWMDSNLPYAFLFSFVLVGTGAIGFIDDYLKIRGHKKGISAKKKFLFQVLIAGFAALYLHSGSVYQAVNAVLAFSPAEIKGLGVEGSFPLFMKYIYLPFYKNPIIFSSSILMFFFSLFVIIGTSNAVNLTDGLDGLATGCMLFVVFVFAVIAFISNHVIVADYLNILYIEGAGEIAIFLSSMLGGLLGFLWFNSYPAQVFMGDTGSLALGSTIALAAIMLRREFLLALVGGVFVVETLSVILQVFSFRFFGRRIFSCAPIHHHFEIKGLHESKIVIRFWMIGLVLAMLGLISLKVQ